MRGVTNGVRALLLVSLIGAAACGFNAPQSVGDGGIDAAVPSGVGFEAATSLEDEESGSITIPVLLSAPASVPITIAYAITGGSAINGVDYTASEAGTLTFNPGDLQQAISLTIHMDPDMADDEDIRFELSAPTGGALLGLDTHVLTINSDILPRVYFTASQSKLGENSGMVSVNIALDRPPGVGVNVPFTVSGTASRPADHTFVNGSVTFQIGEVSKEVRIPVLQDALDEDDETVIVTLVTGTNAVLGSAKVRTHTITDDDPLPSVSFMTATSTQEESAATVQVTVRLDVVSGRDVTVSLVPGGSSGTPGTDFDYPGALSVTIPEGSLSTTFNLSVLDDLLDEDPETAVIQLGTSTTATVTGTTTHTLTITDEDDPPVVRFDPTQSNGDESESNTGPFAYRVVLGAPSGKTVTCDVDVNNDATLGSDYTFGNNSIPVTFAPGATTHEIRITVINDNTNENAGGGNEDIVMTLNTCVNATLGTPATRQHRIRDND